MHNTENAPSITELFTSLKKTISLLNKTTQTKQYMHRYTWEQSLGG